MWCGPQIYQSRHSESSLRAFSEYLVTNLTVNQSWFDWRACHRVEIDVQTWTTPSGAGSNQRCPLPEGVRIDVPYHPTEFWDPPHCTYIVHYLFTLFTSTTHSHRPRYCFKLILFSHGDVMLFGRFHTTSSLHRGDCLNGLVPEVQSQGITWCPRMLKSSTSTLNVFGVCYWRRFCLEHELFQHSFS